jgi:hypothetical protein
MSLSVVPAAWRVAQVPGEVITTTESGCPRCLAFGHLGDHLQPLPLPKFFPRISRVPHISILRCGINSPVVILTLSLPKGKNPLILFATPGAPHLDSEMWDQLTPSSF